MTTPLYSVDLTQETEPQSLDGQLVQRRESQGREDFSTDPKPSSLHSQQQQLTPRQSIDRQLVQPPTCYYCNKTRTDFSPAFRVCSTCNTHLAHIHCIPRTRSRRSKEWTCPPCGFPSSEDLGSNATVISRTTQPARDREERKMRQPSNSWRMPTRPPVPIAAPSTPRSHIMREDGDESRDEDSFFEGPSAAQLSSDRFDRPNYGRQPSSSGLVPRSDIRVGSFSMRRETSLSLASPHAPTRGSSSISGSLSIASPSGTVPCSPALPSSLSPVEKDLAKRLSVQHRATEQSLQERIKKLEQEIMEKNWEMAPLKSKTEESKRQLEQTRVRAINDKLERDKTIADLKRQLLEASDKAEKQSVVLEEQMLQISSLFERAENQNDMIVTLRSNLEQNDSQKRALVDVNTTMLDKIEAQEQEIENLAELLESNMARIAELEQENLAQATELRDSIPHPGQFDELSPVTWAGTTTRVNQESSDFLSKVNALLYQTPTQMHTPLSVRSRPVTEPTKPLSPFKYSNPFEEQPILGQESSSLQLAASDMAGHSSPIRDEPMPSADDEGMNKNAAQVDVQASNNSQESDSSLDSLVKESSKPYRRSTGNFRDPRQEPPPAVDNKRKRATDDNDVSRFIVDGSPILAASELRAAMKSSHTMKKVKRPDVKFLRKSAPSTYEPGSVVYMPPATPTKSSGPDTAITPTRQQEDHNNDNDTIEADSSGTPKKKKKPKKSSLDASISMKAQKDIPAPTLDPKPIEEAIASLKDSHARANDAAMARFNTDFGVPRHASPVVLAAGGNLAFVQRLRDRDAGEDEQRARVKRSKRRATGKVFRAGRDTGGNLD